MSITKDSVASFHYTLKDDDGNTIDTSEGQEPLPYLHGAGNIVPGLERELEGCVIGDKLSVVVKPLDGYGELDETLMQELPKSMFAGVDNHFVPTNGYFHSFFSENIPKLLDEGPDAIL